jgi:4-hydroxybenzoate polyprenyltransferase
MRHFVATRWAEVSALQASPLLGMYLGDPGIHKALLGRQVLLLLGSIALTGHVFMANDWADYRRDTLDLRREGFGVNGYGASRAQIGHFALALLLVANAAFVAVGMSAVLFGAGIAALSLLYSFSPQLGKGTPVAASLNHLVGGALHFLLGYTVTRSVDTKGVGLSVFFGLVFAAGHLTQEVRDYESDRANLVGTIAVTLGPRWGFIASFCLFTVAYLLLAVLAALGVLPKLMLVSAIAWLVQASWSLQVLRRGLGPESAIWMQRRYRLLFALVGLAMLIR